MIIKRRFRGVRQNLKRFRVYWSRRIYEKGRKTWKKDRRMKYKPRPKIKE